MSKLERLTAVKGMNDILPPESARWEWLESKVRALMERYAYRNIRTPIVEPTSLFVRGLGEVTDIVEKEMYSFEDRLNGEQLTLRPEATAGVVRAWSLNTPCCMTVENVCITWVRCFAMNARSGDDTANFIRSVQKRLGFRGTGC